MDFLLEGGTIKIECCIGERIGKILQLRLWHGFLAGRWTIKIECCIGQRIGKILQLRLWYKLLAGRVDYLDRCCIAKGIGLILKLWLGYGFLAGIQLPLNMRRNRNISLKQKKWVMSDWLITIAERLAPCNCNISKYIHYTYKVSHKKCPLAIF